MQLDNEHISYDKLQNRENEIRDRGDRDVEENQQRNSREETAWGVR